jgi:hypothetical protein
MMLTFVIMNTDSCHKDKKIQCLSLHLCTLIFLNMTVNQKLVTIKLIHTAVWMIFNLVIFFLLYAVIANKIDYRIWIGFGLIGLEGIMLLIFKQTCPVTIIARKFSYSTKENFDIYLPNWLAKYNKLIYSIIVVITLILLGYRLI